MVEIVKLQKKQTLKDYYVYQVTLPKKLVEALGWEEGKQLEAKIKKGDIILKPKEGG